MCGSNCVQYKAEQYCIVLKIILKTDQSVFTYARMFFVREMEKNIGYYVVKRSLKCTMHVKVDLGQ